MMAVELQGRQRSGAPAPFLRKTHQIVEDRQTDDVISWGEKGESFVVWKPVEFSRDLLPAHFKHNNFSSFVRQLNTYGFHKAVPNRWEFANDNFRRGEQSRLCAIRRRKNLSPAALPSAANPSWSSPSFPAQVRSFSSTSSPLPPPPPNLLELSGENKKLWRENQSLISELARAKKHLEELLGMVSKFLDVRQINPILLTCGNSGKGGEVEEKIWRDEAEKQGKEEACLKLFGVLLKKNNVEESLVRRKRRRYRGGSVGDLPACRGPLMGVSSLEAGSEIIH